jgi:hypothetical protein
MRVRLVLRCLRCEGRISLDSIREKVITVATTGGIWLVQVPQKPSK